MVVHLVAHHHFQIVELRFHRQQMLSASPLDRNCPHPFLDLHHLGHPVPVRMMDAHLVKMLVVQLVHLLVLMGM
jgi:hypothetical protein